MVAVCPAAEEWAGCTKDLRSKDPSYSRRRALRFAGAPFCFCIVQIAVLDGREQVTLSRLLLKLRTGDVVKFVREIRMYDDEDWERVRADKSGYR